MKIQIREFIETDRQALRALFVAARDAAFTWHAPGSHRLEDFDTVTAGERILVAVHKNTPVGFAAIWEADSFLHSLFVHPDFQRRGVGKALLAACEPFFGPVATLKCLPNNEKALAFYFSQGWIIKSEGQSNEGAYFLMERTFDRA